MIKKIIIILMLIIIPSAAQAVRLKDVSTIYGVRENQLIGYGLVVGLNGTGDSQKVLFTVNTLASMLQKMGVLVEADKLKMSKGNVAAVMITAKLPPFARAGSKIDALASSLGDAESLEGGTLLLTPLKAPDQKIYAVTQGPLAVGGFLAGVSGEKTQKNHTTIGRVVEGAIIERDLPSDFGKHETVILSLKNPDFTTAINVVTALNLNLGPSNASDIITNLPVKALNSGTIEVTIPGEYKERAVELIARIENIEVRMDTPAKVVVNEKTGTVVIGENVRISTVAVAHGGLTVEIKTEPKISQPNPLAKGETVVVPDIEATVNEKEGRLILLPNTTTIGEVIKALNAVGVTPRDLLSILQAIKAAGALHGELEVI